MLRHCVRDCDGDYAEWDIKRGDCYFAMGQECNIDPAVAKVIEVLGYLDRAVEHNMNRAAPQDDRRTYPDTFWRVGSLNTFHRQKATTISYTLADFLQKLEDGLSLLRATEGFESMHFDGGEHLGAFLGHWHNDFIAAEQRRKIREEAGIMAPIGNNGGSYR